MRMSELAAEKEDALSEARIQWQEAEEELRTLQDTPVMTRTSDQWLKICRQRDICGIKKLRFQRAERERFTI